MHVAEVGRVPALSWGMDATQPQLDLSGAILRDHYQVASVTLSFARRTALGREGCWALALGAATLATCMEPDARIAIEGGDEGDTTGVRMQLFGRFVPDTNETVALTLARLRDLGFRIRASLDALLELYSDPAYA